ncbi:MAG: hypothetical protein PHF86_11425 [Candidatus Nanoarchaeia archaeon]|nr:hypothetical protein [Candidatus Nanoarchaeia archaeon]
MTKLKEFKIEDIPKSLLYLCAIFPGLLYLDSKINIITYEGLLIIPLLLKSAYYSLPFIFIGVSVCFIIDQLFYRDIKKIKGLYWNVQFPQASCMATFFYFLINLFSKLFNIDFWLFTLILSILLAFIIAMGYLLDYLFKKYIK